MSTRVTTVSISMMCAASIVGCSTMRPPSGFDVPQVSYVYQAGRASRGFPTMPGLGEHVREALADVGVHSLARVQDPDGTRFEGKTADGRRASVKLFPQGSTTVVSARIGLVGDEPLSRAFLDRVVGHLAAKTDRRDLEGTRDDEISTASGEEPRQVKRFAKNAVPDEVMLRGMEDRGYRGPLEP